jgi:hypothetical protein
VRDPPRCFFGVMVSMASRSVVQGERLVVCVVARESKYCCSSVRDSNAFKAEYARLLILNVRAIQRRHEQTSSPASTTRNNLSCRIGRPVRGPAGAPKSSRRPANQGAAGVLELMNQTGRVTDCHGHRTLALRLSPARLKARAERFRQREREYHIHDARKSARGRSPKGASQIGCQAKS